MSFEARPVVVHDSAMPQDAWDDPVKGKLTFRTLFSGDLTSTRAMTAGVAEMAPGEWLGLHRHDPDETYYVIEGRGVVTLDGVDHDVRPGSAVFIPGGVEHGVRCDQGPTLRILYDFAADALRDVEYHFSGGSPD